MYLKNIFYGFTFVCVLLATPNCVAGVSSRGVSSEKVYRIAFGSCVHQDKEQPVWEAVLKDHPDLFIFLGDNIYGDTEDMKVLQEKYDKQNSKPGLSELRKQTRVIGTWDDHDYGVNDGGAEYPKKEESRQIMLNFFEEPGDSPRRTQDGGVYASYMFGEGSEAIRVILLDTRWARSPLIKVPEEELEDRDNRNMGPYVANEAPEARMLSETQWTWLEKQFEGEASLTIIGSSIQFLSDFTGWESWANFPPEKERLLAVLKKHPETRVMFISGDMHYAEVSKWDGILPYPLWDFTSSGLTQSWHNVSPNLFRVGKSFLEANYGLMEFQFDPVPRLRFQIKNVFGTVLQSTDLVLR
ncbi:MAG: alkaline phosphatase family protein [Deltaproteobacteria bacterium]|nr:alkaline phosphatase family protein [Deltaproteobacteria bacterium]